MSALLLALALACAGPEASSEGPTLDDDPRRQLAEATPRRAADQLRRLPVSDRFGAAFAYGEGAGAAEGLEALVARASWLDRGLRGAFYDGAAHSWDPPAGVPPSHVAQRIREQVPPAHHLAFFDGALISWSEAAEGQAERVLPVALAMGDATDRSPLNGVRIGLQRARGGDLPAALDLARDYPTSWQPALYEELGWRAGDDPATWTAGVCELADRVPAHSRCHFVHGAARGRVLREPWADLEGAAGFSEQLEARSCGCEAAAWRGVAWALTLTWEHRPGVARRRARELPEDGGRRQVSQQLGELSHHPRPAPWVLGSAGAHPAG